MENLFLCFINDIPEGITSLYVDDICMHLILSIGGGNKTPLGMICRKYPPWNEAKNHDKDRDTLIEQSL